MTELCRAAKSTSQAFFTAAFAYLLAVFTGQEDVLFRTIPSKERGERAIPFRLNLKEQDSVVALVQQAESELQQGYMHDAPECAELADALGLNLPFLFCCDAEPAEEGGIVFTQDLPSGGVCQAELRYNNGKHSVDWAKSFTNAYCQIVSEMLAKESLHELVLVGERELSLLDSSNQTEASRDTSDVVAQLRRTASAHPNNDAAITDKKLTRGQVACQLFCQST